MSYLLLHIFWVNVLFFVGSIVLAIVFTCGKKYPHFFTILSNEYPITFFAGLASNILVFAFWFELYFCHRASILDNGNINNKLQEYFRYISFVSMAMGTLAVWGSPLIYCLLNFPKKVNDYYQSMLIKNGSSGK